MTEENSNRVRYAIEASIKGYISRTHGLDHVSVWVDNECMRLMRARIVREWPNWTDAQRDIAAIFDITDDECRRKGDW